MKTGAVVLLIVGLAGGGLAAGQGGFEVKCATEPAIAPLGFPIRVTIKVRNVSTHPLPAPTEHSTARALRWRDLGEGILPPESEWHWGVATAPLAPGEERSYTIDGYYSPDLMPSFCGPGKHTISVALVMNDAEGGKEVVRIEGPVRIEIAPPGPVDEDALKYLVDQVSPARRRADGCFPQDDVVGVLRAGGRELLARFPESTYSAFVVYHTAGAFGLMCPAAEIVRSMEASRGSVAQISVPSEASSSKEPLVTIYGDDVLKWRDKWLPLVLEHHGDLWFADSLRILRALDLIRMHRPDDGAALLATVAKQGRAEEAAKAAELLGLMRQKGWCK